MESGVIAAFFLPGRGNAGDLPKEGGPMRTLIFPVPKEYEGAKLKGFLLGFCGLSAGLLTELKRGSPDGITVNGAHAAVSEVLGAGDVVEVRLRENGAGLPVPVPLPFSAVYEDEDLLAADKPSAMPMYPTPGHDRDSLANAFSFRCAQKGEAFPFRPVYRLDSDTTGLVLLAKNRYAAYRLSGNVEKTYLAVCEGLLEGSGTVDLPIGYLPGRTVQHAVVPDGKKAVTHWRALSGGGGRTFLSLRLETGRTHQIRVHLANIGHPLAGDDMYGGSLRGIGRQALHCARIEFLHPVTRRPVVLESPVPEDMRRLLSDCRIDPMNV